MTRFFAGFVGAALLSACASTANVARVDSVEVSGASAQGAARGRTEAATGFCDKGDVERPMRRRAEDFGACYEEQLERHPTLSGRVDAAWTLGKDGRVVEVETTGLKEVGACVANVIRSIRFRPPLIGCERISRYPFLFELP